MKITDQVCTLQQAKRLKEMGITQEGLYTWLFSPLAEDWAISQQTSEALHILEEASPKSKEWAERKKRGWYSAFTVAELGVMLPNCFDTMRVVSDDGGNEWKGFGDAGDPYPQDIGFTSEAESRAAMLIHMLDTNSLTAEEANKRLKA